MRAFSLAFVMAVVWASWVAVAGEASGVPVPSGRRSTQVWELPKGAEADPGKRDGWKPAAAGAALPGGAAFENDRLAVIVQPDSAGPVIRSKAAGSALNVELALVGPDGRPAKIDRVVLTGAAEDEKALVVTAGRVEVQLKLKPGEAFVELRPVKDAKAVNVKHVSRFALMTDFFAMDVVLDARRTKADKAVALADNFHLMPIDGGNGMVFCVWPAADAKESAREESVVELTASGQGEARKFTESRVFFPGSKPVYVALLEGANYWRCESAASWDLSKPVKSEWQRPFEARWRASFLTQEGKRVPKWGVSILSFYFPELRNKRNGWVGDENLKGNIGWTDRYGNGVPEGAAQGGIGHYAHPCWFQEKDTYLFPLPGGAKENIYEAAIVYPLERSKDTPTDVMTPADILLRTLGVGPCEYILDKEGAVWAFHGGKKKMHFEGATCGNWDSRLAPLLNEWKAKGGALDAEKKQNVVWLIEDMGTFVEAVNGRIHTYEDTLKAVVKLCAEAKSGGREDATLAAALAEQVRTMQKTLSNVAGFDKGLADWQARLARQMEVAKAADAFKPELMQVGDVRGFAESQDNTIAQCRRCVNVIKQQAGLALNESGAGSASLAARIREECRKVLRNPHPLEHF